MKEVLYKKESYIYQNIHYKSHNRIDYMIDNKDSYGMYPPNEKHPLFIQDTTDDTEKIFSENFGNPMWSVFKRHFIVVIEKEGDKVSIKTFHGYKHRRAGVQWFKVSKNVDFISVNIKTGDVYIGDLTNYNLKRKCRKRIRRNYFAINSVELMMSHIRNGFGGNLILDSSMEAMTIFLNQIDQSYGVDNLNFSKRLFKFYLTKRGVKFPNNFYVFNTFWVGPEVRKHLKKCDNRMIDALMIHNNLIGRQVKKALHKCENLNIEIYRIAKNIFGDDWVSQNDDLILGCFNFKDSIMTPPEEFLKFISNEELKKVFKLFKQVIINQTLSSYTFSDHIRMYCQLKEYGEDIKWMSFDNNKSDFNDEHVKWSNKINHYRQGFYNRIYPDYSYELIQKPIMDGDDVYYPILLDNSDNYNLESLVQSNCVKTYIGKCSSIIVSIRKGDVASDKRATIEYFLNRTSNKVSVNRVQSLGKFNSKLSQEWNEILFKLDEIMLSYVRDKRFETPKIKKKCMNGVEFNSNSEWSEDNNLFWKEKQINQTSANYDFF